MATYYQILGISETATQPEIKAAFKRLAVIYHPDKNQSDPNMEELFKEVNHAYQVLSNPYEKARYDIRLKYGSQVITPNYEYSYPTPAYPPRKRSGRPNYSEPKINYRENWIATAYAWGFTFIIAIIVMAFVGIKNHYDEIRKEALLKERRYAFEDSKRLYASGKLDLSLEILNKLEPFFESELDMAHYKDGVFNTISNNASTSYLRKDFEKAIYYFELIEQYAPSKPIVIKEQLAYAYDVTNQPYKSIKKLKELLILDYKTLDVYTKLAIIYRDKLNDPIEARRYFEIADEQTIQNYKSAYGPAYPILLEGRFLPKSHYYLYTDLAEIYLRTGDAEKAIKATQWNKRMWPDSAANYMIAGLGYMDLHNNIAACKEFRKARALGFKKQLPINCY